MSYAFFVNSRSESQCFELDAETVRQSADQVWSQIDWWGHESDLCLLQWRMEIGINPHICCFWNDRATLTIEGGDIPGIAEIALWFRLLAPSQCELYLFSGADADKSIELIAGMSAQEIITTFNQ